MSAMHSLNQRVQAVMGVWREATQPSQHDPLHRSVAEQADPSGEVALKREGSGLQRLERLLLALQKHDKAAAQVPAPVPSGKHDIVTCGGSDNLNHAQVFLLSIFVHFH